MKKNWPIFTALVLAALTGWLDMTQEEIVFPAAILLAGSFTLSVAAPGRFWLVALLLGGSIPLAYAVSAAFGVRPPYPFSWIGGTLLPLGLAFVAAFIGMAIGWLHSVVKNGHQEK